MRRCGSGDIEIERCCRALADRVHDMWFDVDSITFDVASGTVTIPLSGTKTGACHVALICSGVAAVDVLDTEQVGNYDIKTLDFDAPQKTIKIIGNIPIEMRFRVGENWELLLRRLQEPE